MSPVEPPATNEPDLKKMATETSARIREADDKAHEGQVAFVAGEFSSHFRKYADEARKRVQDEYQRITEPIAEGRDSEAGE